MSERNVEMHEPPLRLTVAGLRWNGEEFRIEGSGAAIEIHSTDQGDTKGGELIRVLRETVVERVQLLIPILALTWGELEWDRPDTPTEHDLSKLVAQTNAIAEAVAVLAQLAPEVIEDTGPGGAE